MTRKHNKSPDEQRAVECRLPLNRRNFLISSIAAGVAFAVCVLFLNQGNDRSKLKNYPSLDTLRQVPEVHPDILSFLEKFPAEELASRDSVYEISIPILDNAKHMLIHILQVHDPYGGTKGRANAEVRTVQKNIHDILGFCADRTPVELEEIFKENLMDGDEKTLNGQVAVVRRGAAEADPDQVEADAAIRIAVDRGIRLRAAEDPTIVAENQRWAVEEMNRGKLTPEEYQEVRRIFNVREELLLIRLQKERRRVLFVVYGGLHNFADNIKQWNQAHVGNEFGLMEIKPNK